TRQPRSEWWCTASLEGLASGAGGKGGNMAALKASRDLLLKLFEHPAAGVRHASLQLLKEAGLPTGAAAERALRRAEIAASDSGADPLARADAIDLLSLAGPEARAALFKKLIDPQEPEVVQAAAVRGLGQVKGDEVATFLLSRWRTMTPAVRSEAGYALEADPSRARLVLKAIKDEEIQA